MEKGLVSRLKEKPMRYIAQTVLAAIFAKETLQTGVDFAELIDKYEPQIRNFIGSAGYWTAQIGLPVGEGLMVAGLAYIATKGAGMWLDKHWYDELKSDNPI